MEAKNDEENSRLLKKLYNISQKIMIVLLLMEFELSLLMVGV